MTNEHNNHKNKRKQKSTQDLERCYKINSETIVEQDIVSRYFEWLSRSIAKSANLVENHSLNLKGCIRKLKLCQKWREFHIGIRSLQNFPFGNFKTVSNTSYQIRKDSRKN